MDFYAVLGGVERCCDLYRRVLKHCPENSPQKHNTGTNTGTTLEQKAILKCASYPLIIRKIYMKTAFFA